eukprot:m.215327 g.215327  ORF g.215327 m.215327 type:complete len:231 (-) comp18634_c0_seq4:938-1630(-)
MSVLPKDSVRVVAQAHGFPDIDDDVAVALASDLEYRLREITQEATKFMRHSKRRRLTTQDINNALRHRNLEPIYGYSLPQPEPAKLEQLFRRAGTSDVFYIPDETVDLADFVNSTPLPKLPLDVTFSNHWLAIDGYQPAIPENPPIAIQRPDKPSASANKGKLIGSKIIIFCLFVLCLACFAFSRLVLGLACWYCLLFACFCSYCVWPVWPVVCCSAAVCLACLACLACF